MTDPTKNVADWEATKRIVKEWLSKLSLEQVREIEVLIDFDIASKGVVEELRGSGNGE